MIPVVEAFFTSSRSKFVVCKFNSFLDISSSLKCPILWVKPCWHHCLCVPGLLKVDFSSSPLVFGFSASVTHPGSTFLLVCSLFEALKKEMCCTLSYEYLRVFRTVCCVLKWLFSQDLKRDGRVNVEMVLVFICWLITLRRPLDWI